jgi:hypothetical protein
MVVHLDLLEVESWTGDSDKRLVDEKVERMVAQWDQ